MKRFIPVLLVFFIFACDPASLQETQKADKLLQSMIDLKSLECPDSKDFETLHRDQDEYPTTIQLVRAGKLLFNNGCQNCHKPGAGTADNQFPSIGIGGMWDGDKRVLDPDFIGKIDTPAIKTPDCFTSSETRMLSLDQLGDTGNIENWTGNPTMHNFLGRSALTAQANAAEIAHSQFISDTLLARRPHIRVALREAFPTLDRATRESSEYAGIALSKFQDCIQPTYSPFQEWIRARLYGSSEAILTHDQVLGGIYFFGEGQCFSCHHTYHFAGNEPQSIGTAEIGRFEFTKDSTDIGKVAVPSLYNVTEHPPYFHNGSAKTIKKALKQHSDHLDIAMDSRQIYLVEEFLEALRDPVMNRYGID